MRKIHVLLLLTIVLIITFTQGPVSGSGGSEQVQSGENVVEEYVPGPDDQPLLKDINDVWPGKQGYTVIEGGYIDCPLISRRKDTRMLCIDGCAMEGNHSWDSPHTDCTEPDDGYLCEHASFYSAEACLAMVAASNGCKLSQDRIAYFIFQEAENSDGAKEVGNLDNPVGDLGHMREVSGSDVLLALNWICGLDDGAKVINFSEGILDESTAPDHYTIRDFLTPGHPIIMELGTSVFWLVRGYAIVDTPDGIRKFLFINDTSNPEHPVFIPFEVMREGDTKFYFLPIAGNPVRKDEESIHLDSDNDGICDFDEIVRFKTDPDLNDTDRDSVKDYQDILGYVFNPDGTWNYSNPDMDGDGLPKQLDSDNDHVDNGALDGCEDENCNGFYDNNGRETDCFVAGDDGDVVNPECYAGFIRYDAHIDGCEDSYELIRILPRRVHDREAYDNGFEFDHTDCILVEVGAPDQAIARLASKTLYKGKGQAMVYVSRDADDQFTLEFDIRPDTASATMQHNSQSLDEDNPVHLVIPDEQIEMPLVLNDWILGPDKIGTVELKDDDYIVIKGSYDLYEHQLEGTGYQESWLAMMRSHNGSAVVSWEIWIVESDLE